MKQYVNVFVDLYNDGLIYQGERIINWDPQAKTALSNIEVIHKEIEGAMYYFNYKVVENRGESSYCDNPSRNNVCGSGDLCTSRR